MPSLVILNGPNLNMLGLRQPEVYGTTTLSDIESACIKLCKTKGYDCEFMQSNNEGDLVTAIQKSRGTHAGIILNAGAYTHTSVALMDAIFSAEVPTIEIHLSNVFARESFRHQSYISNAAIGVICGFGLGSYTLAITALCDHLEAQ